MPIVEKKVDFDEFATNYESLLNEQMTLFGGERAYFSRYKIKLLKEIFPHGIESILDFGAGIGLSLPYVLEYFPDAKVHATDISAESLTHVGRKFPAVKVLSDDAVTDMKFDLILVITVLHHVEPKLRRALMKRLGRMLNIGGHLCIFEHNPYNPLTQRMVSTCAFDRDAVLLRKSESVALLRDDARLKISHAGYTLFVPNVLRGLRFLEPALSWLPLGGQYYAIGRKDQG